MKEVAAVLEEAAENAWSRCGGEFEHGGGGCCEGDRITILGADEGKETKSYRETWRWLHK